MIKKLSKLPRRKKDPGRVAAGKRLQEWSKKNKEEKARLKLLEEEKGSWGWKGPTFTLATVGALCGAGAYYWYFISETKKVAEDKVQPNPQPPPKRKKVMRTY